MDRYHLDNLWQTFNIISRPQTNNFKYPYGQPWTGYESLSFHEMSTTGQTSLTSLAYRVGPFYRLTFYKCHPSKGRDLSRNYHDVHNISCTIWANMQFQISPTNTPGHSLWLKKPSWANNFKYPPPQWIVYCLGSLWKHFSWKRHPCPWTRNFKFPSPDGFK